MLVHGFCFFKLVFIGPKELKRIIKYNAFGEASTWVVSGMLMTLL